jgi:hypothetical protein
MKKIAIIGKGTAGAQAAAHFNRWMPECELEWHFDSSIPTQAVGEGSVLTIPTNLFESLNFSHEDLKHIDGTFKTGIMKYNWGDGNTTFMHDFSPPSIGYHFNARALQEYILNYLKDKIKIFDHNISTNDVDADYIMDCSGKPKTYEDFNLTKYIPVNSVHVVQCWWDNVTFQHTKAIATKYGWVFAIPLLNRCSIGYLYNKDINTLDDIKEDIQDVIDQLGLTSSTDTITFSFMNYSRKQNFKDNIAYNGNASFFVEPLEANSLCMMDAVQRSAFDIWKNGASIDYQNMIYTDKVSRIENIVMMHYFAGSKFKTPFWEFAQERGVKCMENADSDFRYMAMRCNDLEGVGQYVSPRLNFDIKSYFFWGYPSFYQNVNGLGVKDKLEEIWK